MQTNACIIFRSGIRCDCLMHAQYSWDMVSITFAGTTNYSCSSGTLSGTSCFSKFAATAVACTGSCGYTCTSGDWLGGTTCNHVIGNVVVTPTYSCPVGTLSGDTCTVTSVTNTSSTATCGYGTLNDPRLPGAYCSWGATINPTQRNTYYCNPNPGGTVLTGSGAGSVCYLAPVYSCLAGWTLYGQTTCLQSLSKTYAAISKSQTDELQNLRRGRIINL
jgi:hypothetical protein